MLLKYILYLGTFFIIWFLIHIVYIFYEGFKYPTDHADIAIIFGNTVYSHGEISQRLKARLDMGVMLFNQKMVDRIFVSGGLGEEGVYEGTAMKQYLMEHDIPSDLIIIDNRGDSSQESVKNILLQQNTLQYKSIIIVSQYFHILRLKMLFHANGFDNISSASPSYCEIRDVYSLFREFFAYFYYKFIVHI